MPCDPKFSLTYGYMLLWQSYNGQCKILACRENGNSLKCNLKEAEAGHHHWELFLNLYIWKMRDFQLFTSKPFLCNFKKLKFSSILKLKQTLKYRGFYLARFPEKLLQCLACWLWLLITSLTRHLLLDSEVHGNYSLSF